MTLQHALTDNKILDSFNRIFNYDETGFPLQYKAPKIIARRGTKHPNANDKSQIIVLACMNAAGATIPPMVIII